MHPVLCWLFGICYAVEQYEEKWQMRGSEHLLLNTEIWGLSTEHATAASEIIKCAAQNQHIPIHFHDISSQCFLYL